MRKTTFGLLFNLPLRAMGLDVTDPIEPPRGRAIREAGAAPRNQHTNPMLHGAYDEGNRRRRRAGEARERHALPPLTVSVDGEPVAWVEGATASKALP